MAQVTLADFESRVWSRLDGNTWLYPKTQVDNMVNEAARDVNLFTGFNQGTATLGLTAASIMWYRIPRPIIFAQSVFLDGKEVQKTTIPGMCQAYPGWLRGTISRQVATWVPLGIRAFAVVPPDANGGKLIEVWGVATPALLVSPNDSLSLDDGYAGLIEDYAVMNLTLKEGGKIFADASKSYNAWLKRIRDLQMWQMKINPRYYVETKTVEGTT